MIGTIRIADARAASSAELAALHARALPPGWNEAEITRLMGLPQSIALAALAPEAVGLFLGWAIGDESEILTLAVAPERRRRGIGGALLEAGLAAAGAMGAGGVILEVGAENVPARALYARAGFREIGRRAGYYSRAGGMDALVLKLALRNGHD